MIAKSFGWSPSAVFAKSGPSTPSTPTSDAAIPRYSSDHTIEWLPRMNVRPSRNWDSVEATAWRVSPTAPAASAGRRAVGGGEGGRVQQKTDATKYRPATTRITASGPAMLMTSGPSRANPSAKAALRVSVKIPFAASSCRRGTTCGIIDSSAGAKNTVTVETNVLSSRMSRKLSPTRNSPMIANPRRTFVATSSRRRSTRST